MDILIFEDDPFVAALLSEVLRDAGFSVDVEHQGARGLDLVVEKAPKLVLTDIMMPGIDGLTLCRALAADPRTSAIKRVVMSAKSYRQDQEAALKSGAQAFLAKPLDLQKVRQTVLGLIAPSGAAAAATPRAARMSVKAWGARAPGQGQATPCVSVTVADRLIVLDAGSGLNALSAASFPEAKEVWVLLTHYHPDHVEGFPALARLAAGRALKLAGPAETGRPLEALARSLGPAAAQAALYQLGESPVQLAPGLKLDCLYTHHPGTTLAYRIEASGASLVYCPDDELESSEDARSDFSEKIGRFARGADLLIHDARFSDQDFKAGQGHSCPRLAAELAVGAGAKGLWLFHAEAGYDAAKLESMRASARSTLDARRSPAQVLLAQAGVEASL